MTTFGTTMKNKALSFAIFILIIVHQYTFAQSDTSLTFIRKGLTSTIPIKKFYTSDQLKNTLPANFPLYIFSEKQFTRVKSILETYIKIEADYDLLRKEFNKKDSVFAAKTKIYNELDSLNRMRTQNYEQAYHASLEINEKMNTQLKSCEALAKKEHNKSKWNTTIFGILGGLSAGLIVGVLIK